MFFKKLPPKMYVTLIYTNILKFMITILKRLLKLVLPQKILHIISDMFQMIYQKGNYGIIFDPTYNEDGLITYHVCSFMDDPLFVKAYNLGKQTGSWPNNDIRWRAYVACWVKQKILFVRYFLRNS